VIDMMNFSGEAEYSGASMKASVIAAARADAG
jgi:hypothetical protein